MFHDMRCCVYVQSAPGDELGCRVYVAGGTLARREKKVLDHVCYDLDVYVGLYDYVFSMY